MFNFSGIISKWLEYVSSRNTFTIVIEMLAVLFFVSWLGMGYIVITNFNEVQEIFTDFAQVTQKIDIRSSTQLNAKVDFELQQLMNKTNSDRAFLDKFHDSKTDLDGVHFIFSSRSNEVLNPGVSSTILNNQNLPIAIFGTSQSLEENKCLVYYNIDKYSISWYQFWKDQGINSTIRCPVFDAQNYLIGNVGIDFVIQHTDNKTEQKDTDLIKDSSNRISGILQEVVK